MTNRRPNPFTAERYIDRATHRPAARLYFEGHQFGVMVILKRNKAWLHLWLNREEIPLTAFVRFLELTAWDARNELAIARRVARRTSARA